MAKLILEKIKDKVKKLIKDQSCIEGYMMNVGTQYKIVHEHFRLANIGFGVPHTFWSLGESIFDFWFDTLQSNNLKVVSDEKEVLRETINKEMKCEPTDKNMKVRINVKDLLGKKFSFIDLFAGIGGFHVAMHYVVVKCVFASEWDKNARISYEANYGDIEPSLFKKDKKGEYVFFNEDINDADPKKIPNFDICCGGFPCQPFSVAGLKKGFEDTRGTLFFDVARILKAKKALWFCVREC